jgi:hypothetical protein
MERAGEQISENQPAPGGVVRDLKRLKSHGAATAAELREFIGQMKGKSPQEVLGLVAKSGLTRAIFLATLLFAVLLVALTVIPYVIKQRRANVAAPVAGQDVAPGANTAQPAETNPPEGPEANGTATSDLPAGQTGASPDADRAIDAMGIGDTRVADPDNNPLEDKLDDLLDGIE